MKSRFTHLRLPLLLAFIFCAATARAAPLNVPSQYGTIQAGINAAQPGDTVLIADGTYAGTGNVNLDYGGKSITIASQNGATKTIIDCQNQQGVHGIIFQSGESAAATLQGVTIENGLCNTGTAGAAVLISSSSSPTLANCVFTNNSSTNPGGAVATGVSCHPSLSGCTFTHNTSARSGGGLYASDRVTVTSCTFTGNTTRTPSSGVGTGGGAYFDTPAGCAITDCTFIANTSGVGGGVASGPNNVFINCAFTGNTAVEVVAGIDQSEGGGFSGPASLINCTFTGNTAAAGAGVAFGSLTNCILFGDNGPELASIVVGTVIYSDVQGGSAGTGNVNVSPLFVSAPGDLHLRTTSPLLGAGTASGAPTTALDGMTRPTPPSIGAFEMGANPLPVFADSSILSSAPTQNFGSAPALTIGGFLGAAYLQFDLSQLPPLVPGSTVKLRVHAGRARPGNASLVVSATTTGWTEAGLTFQTRPPTGLPLGFINVSADGMTTAPYDVDITAYAKGQQALGAYQIGLAMTQFGFGLPLSVDSKENPANDGPRLIVTY